MTALLREAITFFLYSLLRFDAFIVFEDSSLAYSNEQILLLSLATLNRLLRFFSPINSDPLPNEFDFGYEKIDNSSGFDF
jgi:hypothetical protein